MLDKSQFLNFIIAPALHQIDKYSNDACMLLYRIAVHESLTGTYVKQVAGPALGIYQMEPATYDDLIKYLERKPELKLLILKALASNKDMPDCLCIGNGRNALDMPVADRLVSDLKLATIMARVFFWRIPEALPPSTNIRATASYWKKHYNTHLGKGTEADFIKNNGGLDYVAMD